VSRTTSAPPRSPLSSSRAARGCTRTRSVTPPSALRMSSIGAATGLLALLASLQEAEVVLDLGLLLEVQDVGQADDEGADVGAQRAAVRAQVEYAPLHLVGPVLRHLQQAVGLQLRLLDHALGLLARVVLQVLGEALRGEEGVLQDALALPVLLHDGAQGLDLLVEAVALPLERGQLLGHEVQVGAHLVPVVAAELPPEYLPLDVHGRDLHGHLARLGSHVRRGHSSVSWRIPIVWWYMRPLAVHRGNVYLFGSRF